MPDHCPVQRLSWRSGLEAPHSMRRRERRGVPRRPAGRWPHVTNRCVIFLWLSPDRAAGRMERRLAAGYTWSHLSVAGVKFWLLKWGLTLIFWMWRRGRLCERAGPNHTVCVLFT